MNNQDMKEKWNKFCSMLSLVKDQDEVSTFQPMIMNLFQIILGWKEGDIEHSHPYPAGRKKKVYCDILVSKDNQAQFVIEAKKGNHKQTKEDLKQLNSYISLSKTHIGLYIGEKIQLYYDNPDDTNDAELIIESDFAENSENGILLLEQFVAANYSREKLTKFCLDLIQQKNEVKTVEKLLLNLLDDNASKIKEIITMHFSIQNGFSKDIVSKALDRIKFSAHSCMPTDNKVGDSNEICLDNVFFIDKPAKRVYAKIRYENKKWILLAGSKICTKSGPKLRASDVNKREKAILNKEVEKRKDGDWVVVQNITFMSPSLAANFVLGTSSNGWKNWKTIEGKLLETRRELFIGNKSSKKKLGKKY